MKFKNWRKGSIVLLSTAVLLAACGGNKASDKKSAGNDKQEISIMTKAELSTLDPAKVSDAESGNALGQVSEGLYRLDKNHKPIPAVAKEKAEKSKDGLSYKFKLRKDAKWANGEPVTAKDFVYAWQRAIDPKTASQYGYLLADIENGQDIIDKKKEPKDLGVTASDDYTLEVKLSHAVPYFDLLMAFETFYPVNEKFVKEKGDKFGTNSDNFLSNGAFVMKEWDGAGLKWQYAKNDKYWDKKNVKLNKINVQVVKETSTALDMYNGKKLNDVYISGEIAKQEKNNPDYHLVDKAAVFYLDMNQFSNKLLKNQKAREAISLVIDRKQLANNVLGDGAKPATGVVPSDFAESPKTGEYFAKEAGDYGKTDVKKAKKLWAEALKETGESKTTLELVAADSDTNKKVAEYLQGALEKDLEGVKVNVNTIPFKVKLERERKGEFDISVDGWLADFTDPISFIELFVTGSEYNRGKWSNEKFDQLVKDTKDKNVNDPEKRWTDMVEAHKILMDDTAVAPLFEKAEPHLTNKNLKGVLWHPASLEYDYKYAYVK